MSTNYYHLAEPVTYIDLLPQPDSRSMLRIAATDGEPAGSLIMLECVIPSFILLLADRDRLAARRVGIGDGCVFVRLFTTAPDETIVISESGGIYTLAAIKEMSTNQPALTIDE